LQRVQISNLPQVRAVLLGAVIGHAIIAGRLKHYTGVLVQVLPQQRREVSRRFV
jgi:uncharacterized membrane protein YecN with MAPEG domain